MKLTCCCGASIEVDEIDPRLDQVEFERRRISRRNNLDLFDTTHAPCLAKWRENCRPSAGQLIYDRVFFGNLPTISAWKPDPYARFRDAIREGKRVFVEGFTQHTKGKMIPLGEYPLKWEASPDIFFIEGVDIPTQPTKDWLDKYGVGLNGECKVPDFDKDEWCAPRDLEYGPPVHAGVPNPNYYSGRRWIVRKVEKDDGFDAWWAGDGWNVCYGQNKQKELFRKVWTAAQKAKP